MFVRITTPIVGISCSDMVSPGWFGPSYFVELLYSSTGPQPCAAVAPPNPASSHPACSMRASNTSPW